MCELISFFCHISLLSVAVIVFREQLNHYLLTEEQLCQNGYPRPTKNLGIASINRENDRMVPAEIVPIGPNGLL